MLFASGVVCIFEYCFDILVIFSINLSKLLRISNAVLLFGKLTFCGLVSDNSTGELTSRLSVLKDEYIYRYFEEPLFSV